MSVEEIIAREDFVRGYARRSNLHDVVVTDFGFFGAEYAQIAVPCSCGEDDCRGWQMVNADDAYRAMIASRPKP